MPTVRFDCNIFYRSTCVIINRWRARNNNDVYTVRIVSRRATKPKRENIPRARGTPAGPIKRTYIRIVYHNKVTRPYCMCVCVLVVYKNNDRIIVMSRCTTRRCVAPTGVRLKRMKKPILFS